MVRKECHPAAILVIERNPKAANFAAPNHCLHKRSARPRLAAGRFPGPLLPVPADNCCYWEARLRDSTFSPSDPLRKAKHSCTKWIALIAWPNFTTKLDKELKLKGVTRNILEEEELTGRHNIHPEPGPQRLFS